jgi:RimJ/RimL family protein N-acetyltransferase
MGQGLPNVTSVMPHLRTARLELRPLHPHDLDRLAALHAEPSFWRYPLGRGQTRAETAAFLERTLGDYAQHGYGIGALVEGESGELAGWAGLSIPTFLPEILPSVEVGWRLGSAWRGRGYATEAGQAWVAWGFEVLGLERIVSIFEPANAASGRVMEKLGFALEQVTVHPGYDVELRVTQLSRARWSELPPAVSDASAGPARADGGTAPGTPTAFV